MVLHREFVQPIVHHGCWVAAAIVCVDVGYWDSACWTWHGAEHLFLQCAVAQLLDQSTCDKLFML